MKLRRLASSVAALALVATATAGFRPRSAAAASEPGATEANITRLTTNLLEQSQFAHRPFDGKLAGEFLERYLDSLDGSRSLFVQTDVDEFATYRATLAEAMRESGDTGPAQAIFARYLERLKQRADYVADALRTSKFDFTGHDTYSLDREHSPRPRDLIAAKELWRAQLRAEYLQEKLDHSEAGRIADTLSKRYARQVATMKALHGDDVLEVYLDAMTHVYDPHSDYLGHEQMESFSIAMNLSLFGIGATLESADGYCKIRDLVPGGPAARGGLLKPGDRIVAVAQTGGEPTDIVDMPLSHAVELIRGPKGSTVTLRVIPSGSADGSAPETATLVRDEIKLEDQEAKARIIDLPTGKGGTLRLGVIDLPSFYADMGTRKPAGHRSATADVARLLTKLKTEHVQGVVLDLRHNGGGSLEEAISLTGLFIRTGPVVQTRDQAGKIAVDADDDPGVAYDGPLVVLTSRFTASASEIVAGALQDYGRAVIAGDPSTFGKGTVQNILPLAPIMDRVGLAHVYDPGALKVTISKFYRPSGASTQLRGVVSDIVIPSASDLGEVSESALKDALPWDTVPAAPYDRSNQVEPYLRVLREDSARRIAAEKEFVELAADTAQVRQKLAAKSVSLNEAERSEESAHAKARHEAREREERAAHATAPMTYEVTLENVSSPGLPPATTVVEVAGKISPSTKGTSDGNDPDETAMNPSHADRLVLDEGLQILADYVGRLALHGS
jgi:carboxyl-terminal processing protease